MPNERMPKETMMIQASLCFSTSLIFITDLFGSSANIKGGSSARIDSKNHHDRHKISPGQGSGDSSDRPASLLKQCRGKEVDLLS